jgi:hypothetical protein
MKLKMLVASEGKFIHKGTDVVVTEKVENHNIWIEVRSMTTMVRLPYGRRTIVVILRTSIQILWFSTLSVTTTSVHLWMNLPSEATSIFNFILDN